MSDRMKIGDRLTPVTRAALLVGLAAAVVVGILVGVFVNVVAGLLIGVLVLIAVAIVTRLALEESDGAPEKPPNI